MHTPPNWLELDWDALRHNARAVQDYIGAKRTLWAVVKADAYGHGAVQATDALLQAGVAHFIVASLDEAITLREALPQRAFRLMTLYPPTSPDEWRTAAEYAVEGVIDSLEGYARAYKTAQQLGRALPVHLELDTGMSRLGLTLEEIPRFLEQSRVPDFLTPSFRFPLQAGGTEAPSVSPHGVGRTAPAHGSPREAGGTLRRGVNSNAPLAWQSVFTHFACADSDPEFTAEQLRMFLEGVRRLRAGGFPETPLHAAASAGLLTAPDSLLDAVRCGLLLYGIAPTGLESHPLCAQLRPVLSWRARVISVRTIPKGQGVSYGARFRAARPTRVATLSVGYADGYPIGLTNRAPIALRGKLVPQIGRVCMDMLMVDATDLPEVQVGDVATLIGQDGAASVRVETLARLLETTPHELTTRIGRRVARPQV
ncbi:MAG: alanine racemase [Armatimonadetes bacterium]|nr:alanine racemase [Armatimonadota bacterium]